MHLAAIERAVDEAVGFRIADELCALAVAFDESGFHVAAQAIVVGEHHAVEAADDRRDVHGRVEAVLARHAVEEMDAPASPRQPRRVPEIRVDVAVELHPLDVFRFHDALGDPGAPERAIGVP